MACLLLCSASAWAQINLVHVTSCGSGAFPATTCVIPSTGSGNLLVVAWGSNSPGGATTIAGVTDNASNVYLEAGTARAVDSSFNTMVDLWYSKNSRAGATVITITPNPTGTSGTAMIWEFSGVDTTAPLDQTAVLNSQAATTIPSGASVTTASAAEVVVSVVHVQHSVSGILSGNSFTNDSTANGDGWAHLVTSSAGTYASQWNSSSGTYCATTASFKAAGAGGGACDLNQDGVVNVVDTQLAINMDLGLLSCNANINGTGVCDAVVVQRVITAALGGPCVVTNTHTASLSWVASTSSNVTGYNTYRATTSGGPYTKLNSSLVVGASYTDSSAAAGQTYYYVVTAVDSNNIESANSNEATATIPTP